MPNPVSASYLPRWLLIIILGLLSMLMPLSIDMYLPSMPTIAKDYGVMDSIVQLTLSCYLLGFAIGQLIYGPLTDSYGRKSVLIAGLLLFILAACLCSLVGSINQLIIARFLHGLAAAAPVVVVNALLRDLFQERDEFSRMMSFVTLISNLAPLLAPIVGGIILLWFDWHAIFYAISLMAVISLLTVIIYLQETLPKERRSAFSLLNILRNFVVICRQRQVLALMLLSAFASAGLFSFLSLGPFVYMDIYGISAQHFGYFFALNILVMVGMNTLNSRWVKRKGALNMLLLGLSIQTVMTLFLLLTTVLDVGFWALVMGVAGYIGCMSVIVGNAMAIILSYYPYMAGTAASLAGTFRFVIAALVGILLATFAAQGGGNELATQAVTTNKFSEWAMVGSMVVCNLLAGMSFLASKIRQVEEG